MPTSYDSSQGWTAHAQEADSSEDGGSDDNAGDTQYYSSKAGVSSSSIQSLNPLLDQSPSSSPRSKSQSPPPGSHSPSAALEKSDDDEQQTYSHPASDESDDEDGNLMDSDPLDSSMRHYEKLTTRTKKLIARAQRGSDDAQTELTNRGVEWNGVQLNEDDSSGAEHSDDS